MIYRFIKGFIQGFKGECNNKQKSTEEIIEVVDNSNINEQKVIVVPTTQISKKQLLLEANIELIEEVNMIEEVKVIEEVNMIEEDNIMQKNEEINLDKEMELIDLSKYKFLEVKGDYFLIKNIDYFLDIFLGVDLISFRTKVINKKKIDYEYYTMSIKDFISDIGIVNDKLLSWAKKCYDNNIKDLEKSILIKYDECGKREYIFINHHTPNSSNVNVKNEVKCIFDKCYFNLTLSDIINIYESIVDRHLILRKKYNEENKKKNFIDSLD